MAQDTNRNGFTKETLEELSGEAKEIYGKIRVYETGQEENVYTNQQNVV